MKLLKTAFVANDNWRQAPGFDLLHHILQRRKALTPAYVLKLEGDTYIWWLPYILSCEKHLQRKMYTATEGKYFSPDYI